MTSVEHILDKYIDEYLIETETLFTKEEVYKYNKHILPIVENEVVIGMVGLDVFPVEKLREHLPVVRLIYITPEHRKPHSFTNAIRDIMTGLQEQGFKRVEIVVNNKINNWFRRELHSKPQSYNHVQDIEFFTKQLVKE